MYGKVQLGQSHPLPPPSLEKSVYGITVSGMCQLHGKVQPGQPPGPTEKSINVSTDYSDCVGLSARNDRGVLTPHQVHGKLQLGQSRPPILYLPVYITLYVRLVIDKWSAGASQLHSKLHEHRFPLLGGSGAIFDQSPSPQLCCNLSLLGDGHASSALHAFI